jgi:hypothetical protein
MAEQQIDSEIIRKLNEGLSLTADEAQRLARSAKGSSTELDKWTSSFGKHAAQVGRDFGRLAADTQDASKGFDDLGAAIGGLARTIPVVGDALGGSLQFLLTQVGATAKSFTDLSQVGALSAKGMTGLREQFYRSGLSLQAFDKITAENAGSLARFRGVVSEGAGDLSAVIGDIAYGPLGDQLRRLGVSTDMIGEHAASFVAQQTSLGIAQTKTNKQLVAGSGEYIRELDMLAKLTGQSRKTLEQQRQDALRESKYRAALMGMQGEEGERIQTLNNILMRDSPTLAKAMRATVGGYLEGNDAIMGFNSTMGSLQDINEKVKQGLLTPVQGAQELQKALKDMMPQMQGMAAAVGDIGTYIPFAEAADFSLQNLTESAKKIATNTEGQITGQDAYTDSVVASMRSMELFSRQVSLMGFELNAYVVPAIQYLSESLLGLVRVLSYIPGMPELPTLPGIEGGGTQGPIGPPPVDIGKEMTAGAVAYGGMGAVTGAGIGAFFGGIGAVPGAAIGGAVGTVIGAGTGLAKGMMAPSPAREGSRSVSGRVTKPGEAPSPQQPVTPKPLTPLAPRPQQPAASSRSASGRLEKPGEAPKPQPPAAPVSATNPNAPTVLDPNTLLTFNGGLTGNRNNFDALNPDFQKKILQMAQEYQTIAGKKLTFTSGFRTPEQQAAINSGTNPKAEPGMSMHQSGRAIDVDRTDLSILSRSGLLGKYGFGTIAGDANHIEARALGGPTRKGSTYLVGEQGPELFTPAQDGNITSNDALNTTLTRSGEQQSNLMMQQISRLDEVVRALTIQNNITSRMLQQSTA